jgi:hypothetical protein
MHFRELPGRLIVHVILIIHALALLRSLYIIDMHTCNIIIIISFFRKDSMREVIGI